MILVVIDDDPANIKFVRFILANEDIEIHAAGDAQSGMELIHQKRPQIVLLDLVMPGVHGMEVLQKILEFDPGISYIDSTVYYWRIAFVPSPGGQYRWNYSSFMYKAGSAAGFNQFLQALLFSL